MRLTKAIGFALGFVYASTHALRIHHDAASLAAGLPKSATTFDDPQPPVMRLMRRQRPTALDVAQHKREDSFETTTKTHTAHSTIQSTVTIVPTTTISVHGPPPRHSSGFPPSSSNGTVHLTDKMLSSNTGLPTITHSTLSFTLTTARATCVIMAGGCVLCPGDSLDTCPGATFTTPKGMPSGACAAVDGNCVGGETAVPTTVASITAPAHAPGSGISTVLAGETHKTTTFSSTVHSTHTTMSTHSSTPTHKTTSTTSSTIVQKAETTAMSPKDSAAFSFLDTAVDLEKQLLGYLHPDKSPAGSPTATSHLPPFATMRQEIAALSSELKDLAALHSSTTSTVPPAPFATPESPAPGCHANSNGSMILMVKPNHDEAQKPSATINDPVNTGKRLQLIDGKLMDKMGRHGFVNIDNTLQWLEPEGGQARISQFSVCGTENHLALVQTNKWWRCDVDGGHDFVSQLRGGKCPKIWLALVPEGQPPTTTALPPTTASTHTSTISVLESIPSSPVVPVAAPLPVMTTTSTKLTTSTPSSLLSTKTTSSSTMLSGLLTTATAAALDCHQDGPNGTMKLMVHHGTSMPQTANLTDTGKRVPLHGGILSDMHGRIAAIQDNRMLVFLRPQDIIYAKWNMTFLRCDQAGFLGEVKSTGKSISWFSCDDDLEGTYRDNPTDGHCDPVSLLLQEDKPVMSTHTTIRPLGSVVTTLQLHPLPPRSELELDEAEPRASDKRAHSPPKCPTHGSVISSDGLCGIHDGIAKSCDGSQFGDCCRDASAGDVPHMHVPAHRPNQTEGSSPDGKCGIHSGKKTCEGSKFGGCCGKDGTCGRDTAHCNAQDCSLAYSSDCSYEAETQDLDNWLAQGKLLSKNGFCGQGHGYETICASYSYYGERQVSGFGHCCSHAGSCGIDDAHCAPTKCNPLFGECSVIAVQQRSDELNVVSDFEPHPLHPRSELDPEDVDPEVKLDGEDADSSYDLDPASPVPRDVPTMTLDGKCDVPGGNKTCAGSRFGECCSMEGLCGNGPDFCNENKCTNTYSGPSCGSDPIAIPYWHWYHNSMKQLSTDGTCGLRNVNSSRCRSSSSFNDSQIFTYSDFGRCCSVFGYCGMGKEYCERPNCDPTWGQCNDFTWQGASNDPGTISAAKPKAHPALSEAGTDGVDQVESRDTTSNELDMGILLDRDIGPLTTDGTCGIQSAEYSTCRSNDKDSDFGGCCSNFGYCGSDEAHCAYSKCQRGGQYGRCDDPTWQELSNDHSVIDSTVVQPPCVADQSCGDPNSTARKRQDGDAAVETVTGTPVTVTATTSDSPTDSADPNASDADSNAASIDASDPDDDSTPVATMPTTGSDADPITTSASMAAVFETATDSTATGSTATGLPVTDPSPSSTGMVVAVTGALTSYVTTLEVVKPSAAAIVPGVGNTAGYITASPSSLGNGAISSASTTSSSHFSPMWDISTFIATGLTPVHGPISVSVFHSRNTTVPVSGTGTIPVRITTATGSPSSIAGAEPESTHTQKASAEPALPNAMTHAVATLCGLLACAVFAWRL